MAINRVNVFKNEAQNLELQENGYIIMDLLPEKEIANLSRFFHEIHPGPIPPFYATAHSTEERIRMESSRFIHQQLKPYLDPLVQNCMLLGGSFIVKTNESDRRLEAHQDWNLVDEAHFRSYNLWVPLVETQSDSGALKVLPGSHNWPSRWRGPNTVDPLQSVINEIWEEMLMLALKPGQAILYDHALYHGSFPNFSSIPRIALVLGLVPSGAELLHPVQEDIEIALYRSTIDFYLSGNIQGGHKNLELKTRVSTSNYNYLAMWNKRQSKQSQKSDEEGFTVRVRRFFSRIISAESDK